MVDTTRTTYNQVIRGEIELAWGDTDDDILSFDGVDELLVTHDGRTSRDNNNSGVSTTRTLNT